MKANEAPEKIYRTTFYLDDDKGDTKWKKTPVAGAENIEYVRTDAFIEKACDAYCTICDTKECDGYAECTWVIKFRRQLEEIEKGK